jgi:hypothetical protein
MCRYTFWVKLEPTCHMSKARPNHLVRRPAGHGAGPALQVRPALPRGSFRVQCTSSPTGTTWMNEIHQGNVSLIEWRGLGSLGSMGPLVQPLNCHNRHSKAILGVPEQGRFITWHGGGSAAPPNRCAGETDPRNRPSTASGAVIRSLQGERRWIIGPATPLDLATPMVLGPCAQLTFLAYKRHLTLAGLDTQH